MIYRSYEEQRSFRPEYVDFIMRDLVDKPVRPNQYPVKDHLHLAELIQEGYFPMFNENEDLPEWMINEEAHKISFRRVKKYAKKLFQRYGEKEKALELICKIDRELAELELSLATL